MSDYLKKHKAGLKDQRRAQFERTAEQMFRCRGCGVKRRGDEYYFDHRYANGRDLGECKKCHSAIDHAKGSKKARRDARHYRKRRQYNKARSDFFTCRACGHNKRGYQFVFHYRFPRGVYVTACKDCKRKKDKEYYERRKRARANNGDA